MPAYLDAIDKINDVLRNAICVIYVDFCNAFGRVALQNL